MTSLLALKPRQVLLAEQLCRRPLINECVPKMVNKQTQQGTDCFTGKPELKSAVQKSILSYLHKNGFSKTLKRFLKEANMESEDWKTTSVDLEDIYARYAVQCEYSDVKNKGSVQEDSDKNIVKHKDTGKLIGAGSIGDQNDKSKKEGSSISQSADNYLKDTEILPVVSVKKRASSIAANGHDEITNGTGKAKGKKDKKKRQTVADCSDVPQGDGKAESKGKKKKKVSVNNESEFGDNVKSLESGDKKVSKKRKSAASSVGEEQPVEDLVNGESKRRKIDQVRDHHTEKSEKEESMINGDKFKNGVQHSSEPKSLRKERNVSNEPRSANAFQRVKAEEVEVDDRLQNNSYWAKDGAEYGYGAKAQEVLGQVKGKDFRHEKTKKKRGSYRGGQIDFEAHSVKFNYSDEE